MRSCLSPFRNWSQKKAVATWNYARGTKLARTPFSPNRHGATFPRRTASHWPRGADAIYTSHEGEEQGSNTPGPRIKAAGGPWEGHLTARTGRRCRPSGRRRPELGRTRLTHQPPTEPPFNLLRDGLPLGPQQKNRVENFRVRAELAMGPAFPSSIIEIEPLATGAA